MRKQRHAIENLTACPMEATLDIISGKWKGIILHRVGQQTRRFNELNRLIRKVSPRTLTKQLRELERDGLIRRTVYAQVPPKVEYDLTQKGQTLRPVLAVLMDWGQEHVLNFKD